MNPPLNEYAGPVVVSSITTNSDDHHVLTLRRLSDHLFEIGDKVQLKTKTLFNHLFEIKDKVQLKTNTCKDTN